MMEVRDDFCSPKPTAKEPRHFEIRKDGTLRLGSVRFSAQDGSIRAEILKLIAQNEEGFLRKNDYRQSLIDSYFNWKPAPKGVTRVITPNYKRRQNSVDKAISRLRQDLNCRFQDYFPEGTQWLCFSKKVDGWLLYKLPGLGCDGTYHW